SCPGGPLLASLTLIGIRPALALTVFGLVRPGLFRQPTRREWRIGLFIGLINFSGGVLQIWGLSAISPALSGFFTSMASLWVPLLALLVLRVSVTGTTWLGFLLGLCGLAVLGIHADQGWQFGWGEALTAIASLIFAVVILCLYRWGQTVRSGQLTLALIAAGGPPGRPFGGGVRAAGAGGGGRVRLPGGAGVGAWFDWLGAMLSNPAVLRDVVLLTLLSTVLATFLLGTFQPRVPASRAALIYLLEPVFTAVLSVVIGHDHVTVRLVLGG